MRVAPLVLRAGDRARLAQWADSPEVAPETGRRATIVLLAAAGRSNTAIAQTLGVSRPTVILWRDRYARGGADALHDRPRSGRPRVVEPHRILAATLRPLPPGSAVPHWTSRTLAAHLRVSHPTVTRAWRRWGVAPWRGRTFRFATRPPLYAVVTGVVGLCLAPTWQAAVLCVDERSRQHALDPAAAVAAAPRTAPRYRAAATLHAALRRAARPAAVAPVGSRPPVLAAFVRQVARATPATPLHVVVHDRDRTDPAEGDAPLTVLSARLYRVPTLICWLNLTEVWLRLTGPTASDPAAARTAIAAIVGIGAQPGRAFVWVRTGATG